MDAHRITSIKAMLTGTLLGQLCLYGALHCRSPSSQKFEALLGAHYQCGNSVRHVKLFLAAPGEIEA